MGQCALNMSRRKNWQGYDINTGEPITEYRNRLEHVGNGYYVATSSLTKKDRDRKKMFDLSVDLELKFKKQGFEEH